uniref:Uncharacterized protein LOC105044557 n=1 Tax=Elaeis guineensis var. tenera TaxID=51953 RepID=A0A6I9R5G9_ELAGV|nr:uncharacterized protein LOC105044557 [Elaeis guineensis]
MALKMKLPQRRKSVRRLEKSVRRKRLATKTTSISNPAAASTPASTRSQISPSKDLPQIKISSDTSKFPYKHAHGSRSALRLSRIVSETLRLKMDNVRWFVMGDDDTVFIVENMVRVLRKYDHKQLYYIGSSSESHVQNILFSYGMAYGGGGFAISYPLAVELEKMQDRCMQRYAGLYGSDDRIHACMAELGVPLTREAGFHQYDVYGDLLGLLAAHPVAPLVSLHHLDVVEPIFPGMKRAKAIQHLLQSANLDSASIMQQSICYDKKHSWSISVSWGYAIQVSRGLMSPRELITPARTFLNWYKRADYFAYSFNTRPVARHPCQHPFTYYISSVRYDNSRKQIISNYSRQRRTYSCRWKMPSPETINNIIVFKKPDPLRWKQSPRRDCCKVLTSGRRSTMHILVSKCQLDEHPEL